MGTKQKLTAAGTISAGAIALAVGSMIGPNEGLRLVPYYDQVGKLTWCYGETNGPYKDKYTKAECDAQLIKTVTKYAKEIAHCVPPDLPEVVQAVFVDVAYNIGPPTFCKSSISKNALAGNLQRACSAILLYNKGRINGKLVVIKGLTKRRQREYADCIGALK